jgi:hypothetical protein
VFDDSLLIMANKFTEKQRRFISAKADGLPTLKAGELAGYHHPNPTAYQVLATTSVIKAIEQKKLSRLDKTKALIQKSLKKVELEVDKADCDPRYALLAVKELTAYADKLGTGSEGANLHEVTSRDISFARHKRILAAIRYLELGSSQPSKAGILAAKLRAAIGRPRVLDVSPTTVDCHE